MVEKSINLATEEYVNNTVAGLSNRIDILTELVDVPPVYTKPSLSLSLSTTIAKHNEEITVVITPNYIQNDAGEITEFILKKDGVELVSSSSFIQRYTDTINLKHGENVVYSATVSYADGPIKNTTLGFPYPSTSIKAGVATGSNVVKAYGNSIIGVVDTDESGEDNITIVNTFLNPKKEYTNVFSLVNQKIVYMYPSSYGELKSIKDANNFEYINSYSKSIATYDEVEYYVYILIDPVTITSFKQIFS